MAKRVSKKVAKKFLSVPPKLSQLRDLERTYSIDMDNSDFERIVQFAVPEIGKQISRHGVGMFGKTVQAIGKLTTVIGEYEDLTNWHAAKNHIAQDLGFCESHWQRDPKTCNGGTVDFDDLYERGLEVEIVVHVRRRLKTKEQIATYGIK